MERYPEYIDTEMRWFLERARLTRRWGVLNVWTCRCGWELVAIDLDEGVTPMFVACEADGCTMLASSAMYRDADPLGRRVPTHGWYRPEALPRDDRDAHHHLRQGGLLLRELTAEDLAVFAQRGDGGAAGEPDGTV